MIGQTVSHYEIREQLGRGGMGVVYKAWDTRLDRWVALKFLPQHANDDPLARERFVREAKAASALEHPHICTIHEIGETDDGQLYICMAFYDGPNLRKALNSGRISALRGLEVARQLCNAIARAHDAGIVHRDLKPSNIMTTAQGDVAIVDFGLAKLAGEISLTKTGATLGTTAYMSPEQLRGEDLDFRTDLWSLGVIIYQLLTGKYPFKGDYDQALQRSILEDDPEPPSGLATDLPQYVDVVMQRLLAKDRTERFSSAGEIAQVLRAMEQAESSEVATQVQLPKVARTPLWKRVAWRPLALAAVLLALAAIAWGILRTTSQPSRSVQTLAVMPFSNYTGDESQSFIADGIAAGLINALSEVSGLTVLSRSEAWRFRDRDWGARKLGEQLGVGTLLEGTVQGSKDSVTVTTNLIDVPSGSVVWTAEVDGSTNELPDLTRQIAGRLTDVLSIRLSDRERRRLAKDPTRSFEAYEHYLRGQQFLADRHKAADLDAAIELFKQAIRVDPEFALAHVALSESYWEQWRRQGDQATLEEAEAEAEKALKLDPELPAAQVALARVYRSTGNYDDSIEALQAALANHPNPDAAQRELARSYESAGDLESAEASLRAATLVGEDNWSNWNALGAFLWRKGDFDEAREAFRKAAKLSPPDIFTPVKNLAANELSAGNFDEAIDLFAQIPERALTPTLASNFGTAYYFSDRPDKWGKARYYYELAARLNPRDDEIRRNLGDLFLELGRTDQARAQYMEALRLVDEKLRSDPKDWNLRLKKALYAARASDCPMALGEVAQLETGLPDTGPNAQQTAYVYALCGDTERALSSIERAVSLGVSRDMLRQEPEFESLKDEPRFEALVGPQPG